MKTIAIIISGLALLGTLLPSILFWAGQIALPTVKTTMLIATILWFVSTPFWMEHKLGE